MMYMYWPCLLELLPVFAWLVDSLMPWEFCCWVTAAYDLGGWGVIFISCTFCDSFWMSFSMLRRVLLSLGVSFKIRSRHRPWSHSSS